MAELGQMPPPYSKDGYSQVPQTIPGMAAQQQQQPGWQQPTQGYAPAPPVLNQQSSNTNVVVVSQPSTLAHTTIIQPRPRANEYLILTVVLMVLCFIHGNLLAFFCLVPALICSYVASDHNNAGEYEEARRCGQMALACNIFTIVKYVILIVIIIILVIVYVAVGFGSGCDYQCTYNYYGERVCNCV